MMRVLINTCAVILISLLVKPGQVSAEPTISTLLPDAFPGSGGLARPFTGSDLPPAYPQWPERPVRRQIIPPPPGGPYMSSAMSEIDAFPDDSGGLRNISDESTEQRMDSPFFKVDMPWPETPERDAPELWMPESGEYKFVPEELVRELESSPPGRRLEQQMYQPYPRYPPAPPPRRPYYGYY